MNEIIIEIDKESNNVVIISKTGIDIQTDFYVSSATDKKIEMKIYSSKIIKGPY